MASSSRSFRSLEPGQIRTGCYIDCRFETDMKLLLGKMDRMEALIEKLVEVMYITQTRSSAGGDPLESQTIMSRSVKRDIETHTPQNSETFVYRDIKPIMTIEEPNDDEIEHSYSNVEQYQIEEKMEQGVDQDEDEEESYDMKEDQDGNQIQHLIVPRAVSEINGISLPVTTLEDLRALDLILSEHPAMGRELKIYLEDLMLKEKTFRDVMKHLIIDEVIFEYSDHQMEFRNLFIIKNIVREAYGKHKDLKNYSRRLINLFLIDLSKRNDQVYEISDCRLPIHSAKELVEIEKRINSNPDTKEAMIGVVADLFLSSDRNITNLLAKMLKKEVVEECSWNKIGGSKRSYQLSDYTLFNSIVPEIIGMKPGSKQLEANMRLSLHQLRRRNYAVEFRKRAKAKKQFGPADEYGDDF